MYGLKVSPRHGRPRESPRIDTTAADKPKKEALLHTLLASSSCASPSQPPSFPRLISRPRHRAPRFQSRSSHPLLAPPPLRRQGAPSLLHSARPRFPPFRASGRPSPPRPAHPTVPTRSGPNLPGPIRPGPARPAGALQVGVQGLQLPHPPHRVEHVLQRLRPHQARRQVPFIMLYKFTIDIAYRRYCI